MFISHRAKSHFLSHYYTLNKWKTDTYLKNKNKNPMSCIVFQMYCNGYLQQVSTMYFWKTHNLKWF